MNMINVINIMRFSTEDGPGIRTTVFLKGCPLRCAWCHNPESQLCHSEIMFQQDKCSLCGACVSVCPSNNHKLVGDKHLFDRKNCIGCYKCIDNCPLGALTLSGKKMSINEIFEEVQGDKIFYDLSGGGITVSGGEPLLHPEATFELLEKCKTNGIHTAIETCGYAKKNALNKVVEVCDFVLFDIKETDKKRHEEFTGVPLEPIIENLKEIDLMNIPILIRMPIIPGYNDRNDHFQKTKKLSDGLKNCIGIEIMPYHKLGEYKYRALNLDYRCKDVEEPALETVARWRKLVK